MLSCVFSPWEKSGWFVVLLWSSCVVAACCRVRHSCRQRFSYSWQ